MDADRCEWRRREQFLVRSEAEFAVVVVSWELSGVPAVAAQPPDGAACPSVASREGGSNRPLPRNNKFKLNGAKIRRN